MSTPIYDSWISKQYSKAGNNYSDLLRHARRTESFLQFLKMLHKDGILFYWYKGQSTLEHGLVLEFLEQAGLDEETRLLRDAERIFQTAPASESLLKKSQLDRRAEINEDLRTYLENAECEVERYVEQLEAIRIRRSEDDSSYRATIVFLGNPADILCACQGCDWRGTADDLGDIEDCYLTPGHASPAGHCPECERLSYVIPQHASQRSDSPSSLRWTSRHGTWRAGSRNFFHSAQ